MDKKHYIVLFLLYYTEYTKQLRFRITINKLSSLLSYSFLPFQVKIWFQNRRMKMKKMAERDKQEKEQMEREKQALNIKLLSITHTSRSDAET